MAQIVVNGLKNEKTGGMVMMRNYLDLKDKSLAATGWKGAQGTESRQKRQDFAEDLDNGIAWIANEARGVSIELGVLKYVLLLQRKLTLNLNSKNDMGLVAETGS
uniref:Uncharacterized protein n=1 Tax=Micrurus lemniscatus lemniscatus TaxID=129467 RepID=A0A2D4IX62_MICLE